MFFAELPIKKILKPILIGLLFFSASFVAAPNAQAKVIVESNLNNLGTISGIVRDETGNAIAGATVAIFRVGTSRLLKQVRSASDGSFLAKIMPGTYTVLAVAQGFNPVTLPAVRVDRSTQLVYGFKLERSGSGNTLPEKKADRNSSKWRIRSAQTSRSVYQTVEGDIPVDETAVAETQDETEDTERNSSNRRGETVVESYFANSADDNFTGFNFARLQPLGDNAEIVFLGQLGTRNGDFTDLNRFQANVKLRPVENHQIHLSGAVINIGKINIENRRQNLGQVSFQALDEWQIKNGVIVVFGFDYSRFFGAGNDFSISPRIGFQFDLNSRTRFRTSYTAQTEQMNWQNVVEMEGTQVLFREPVSIQDIAVESDVPIMNKSTRLEFGIERVLSNKSNVEAALFFDTIINRGIGLTSVPFGFSDNEINEFSANQQGGANGVRVVYSRRINGRFSAVAGYAFGNGQKLSEEAISNPANLFEADFFQTFFGQFDAALKTGTQIRTIFRFSPQATVFAIDPFQGRLAIYDPNLSVTVTQSLPNLGLPIRAKAIIDARNLFDTQTNINDETGSLRLNSQGRTLRGTISVRF